MRINYLEIKNGILIVDYTINNLTKHFVGSYDQTKLYLKSGLNKDEDIVQWIENIAI